MVIWLNLNPGYHSSKENCRRRIFLKQLVSNLVTPLIFRRNTTYLTKVDRADVDNLIGPKIIKSREPQITIKTRTRCYLCPSKIGRASKQGCEDCGLAVCNQHSQKKIICQRCRENNGIDSSDN